MVPGGFFLKASNHRGSFLSGYFRRRIFLWKGGKLFKRLCYFAADVKATLSIPSFFDNFDMEAQALRNPELKAALVEALSKLK